MPQCSCHDHAHHHRDDEVLDESTLRDPGNQAIAEALRLCFIVLKLVMVGAVLAFIWNGFFTVQANEQAVVLRFGALRGGESLRAILKPGLHWAWPFPIDEVIKIPGMNAEQELIVNDFWYSETELEAMGAAAARAGETLQFTRDGYSLTASQSATSEQEAATDYNIAHSKWKIRYRITDARLFFNRVWSGKKNANKQYDWKEVEELLRSVLADAVVVTSAQNDIWAVWILPAKFREDVERCYQERLAALDLGIEAQLDLLGGNITPPRQVAEAFNRASSASITAQEYKKGAEAQRDQTISKAKSDATILISQAEAYKTTITQSAMADAQYLKEILARIEETAVQRVGETEMNYRQKREQMKKDLLAVTVDQLYQEMLREVMSRSDETFVLKAGANGETQWRPILSRDATLKAQAVKGADEDDSLYKHQPAAAAQPGPGPGM